MWRLILKDIDQHKKAVSLFFLVGLVMPAVFSLIIGQTEDGSGYLGVVFGYVMMGAPAMFSFLLIGQEKLKGTFKLLSILPIAGKKLILAKSLGVALLCLSLANLACVVSPLIIRLTMGYECLASPEIIFWANLLTLFFVSVDVAVFTLFESKIASQIAYLLFAFMGFTVIAANKYFETSTDPQEILLQLKTIGFQYWGWTIVISVSCAIVMFAGRLFEMKEWAELEEN